MIKKLSILVMVSIISVNTGWSAVTVTWQTTATFLARDSSGVVLPATGSSATAGFCQLLYIGAAYDGLDSSGDGTLGDDAVLQTTYIGTGIMSAAGSLLGTYNNSTYAIGSQFVIRFFDTPSLNYAGGDVPTIGNYGLSQVYTTTQVHDGTPASETFAFNANYNATTPVAVPEPSTVALMLAGLGVLGYARLRRKS